MATWKRICGFLARSIGGAGSEGIGRIGRIVRLLVELLRKRAHTLAELGSSFAEPSCDFGKFRGSEQNEDQAESQNYFPSIHNRIGDHFWTTMCLI